MANDAAASDWTFEASQARDAGAHEFDGVTFEAIEAAVMDTSRGRWFLGEYARRVRAGEMARIEAALGRIEQRLSLAADQVAASGPASGSMLAAAGLASGSVRDAETRIIALSVHQRLIDLAAALRASGVDEDACARIEAQANALVELARRRNLIEAGETPDQAEPKSRVNPAG